jgi:hypothetical protein
MWRSLPILTMILKVFSAFPLQLLSALSSAIETVEEWL